MNPYSRVVSRSPLLAAGLLVLGCLAAPSVRAHGDTAPQAVDTHLLKPVKDGPLSENPYRGDAPAAKIGASAFNQNCARCHGLGAVSGGIAPDLRYLPVGKEGDEYFAQKVRNGVIRNGVTYMPAFGSIFTEEAVWAIRTWLETVHTEQ